MAKTPFWQRILIPFLLGTWLLALANVLPVLAATNCPVSSDTTASTLPNPGPNDPTTSGGNLAHHQQHDNENDAIRCIEAYIGFNASQTAPTAANAVLNSTSSTASTWSTTPTIGTIALQQNPAAGSATTLVNSATIASALGVQRVTSAGNITGLILTAGTLGGQMVHILNTSANTMTFAAAGTSNVSGGAGVAIAAGQDLALVWSSVEALWYPVGPIPLAGAGVTTAATLTSGNCVVGAGSSAVGIQASGYGYTCSTAAVALSSPAPTCLTIDTALNNTANYFDGPSQSFAAGTWNIVAALNVMDTSGSGDFPAKLWDGSTIYATTQIDTAAANNPTTVVLIANHVVLGSPTTLKASVQDRSSTSGLIKATTPNGSASNTASCIQGTRTA